MLIKEIKIINLDIKPNNGGNPARDKIREIIIILLVLFFCVNINSWFPTSELIKCSKGIEIII